jgi:hypothetical protein
MWAVPFVPSSRSHHKQKVSDPLMLLNDDPWILYDVAASDGQRSPETLVVSGFINAVNYGQSEQSTWTC